MIIMLILSLLVSLCNLKLKSLYVKIRFIILELIIYFKSNFLKHHKPDFLQWVSHLDLGQPAPTGKSLYTDCWCMYTNQWLYSLHSRSFIPQVPNLPRGEKKQKKKKKKKSHSEKTDRTMRVLGLLFFFFK